MFRQLPRRAFAVLLTVCLVLDGLPAKASPQSSCRLALAPVCIRQALTATALLIGRRRMLVDPDPHFRVLDQIAEPLKAERVSRPRFLRMVLPILFSGMTLAVGLSAQDREGSQNEWSFGINGGFNSPHIMTDTPTRDFVAPSFRGYFALSHGPHFALDYVMEVNPLVVMLEPKELMSWSCITNGVTAICDNIYQGPKPIFGTSASPVGFSFRYKASKRLAPYLIGGVGYLWTPGEKVPYQDEPDARFNFSFYGGIGVRVHLPHDLQMYWEERYQHYSDANTTDANEGIDSWQHAVGIVRSGLHISIPRLRIFRRRLPRAA